MRSVRIAAAVLLSSLTVVAHGAGREPVTHEALWLMKRVQKPVPSPDGKWVVFSMTEPSYEEKKQVVDLWIVPTDGSVQPRRLTAAAGSESDPSWSADSRRLAFAAKRGDDEVNQIYVLDVFAGGEAQRVTSVAMAARSPRFSPDGSRIAFLSAAYPSAADDEANRQLAKERKERKANVRAYETFPIRRWDRWLDDTQTHLQVVNVGAPAAPAKPRDLLAGTKLITRGFSGRSSEGSSDDLDLEWTPDGRSLVFVATDRQHESAWASAPVRLWQVSVDGGEPVRVTQDDDSYARPRFSPDGRSLCFTVTADSGKYYALDRLGCVSWPGGTVTKLTASFDRSVGSWDYSPDSRHIYFTAENEGHENIYRVSTRGGDSTLVAEATTGVYTALAIPSRAKQTILLVNWGSSINPNEIARVDESTKKRVMLTAFNAERAAALDWREPLRFSFRNSRGRTIQNYLVLPQNFDEKKKYPIFSLIHGGAANMWRDAITLRWNYHLIASPGYVVLLTDYTGSTGYGEAFTQALVGDPLKGPAEDINEAVDEAIRRYQFIDGTRQAAGGASYGGHLANWLEGTTTRYKFLVSHAGLANLESQWGTSDGIYHRELVAQGPVWEQGAVWREQNPVRNAANFKTPMLLSVGEKDFRVPLNNTLEMWSYLQRMRVPSRLLVWPEENHWILNGENGKVFYRELHDWFKRWM